MEQRLSQRLQLAIEQLKNEGLNLLAIMGMNRLPEQLAISLAECTFPVSEQTRVILIGHGGRALWKSIPAPKRHQADPIDRYSREAAGRFARRVLAGDKYQIIYPGNTPVALQQLGRAAGWHTPSPLGIGINPHWGLWYAYRVAMLTNAPLAEIFQPAPPSPCAACDGKPCIEQCPPGALNATSSIDMSRCAGHRLAAESSCADRCLARLGCPVASEQRYTLEQTQYHYRHSLETLRHYF